MPHKASSAPDPLTHCACRLEAARGAVRPTGPSHQLHGNKAHGSDSDRTKAGPDQHGHPSPNPLEWIDEQRQRNLAGSAQLFRIGRAGLVLRRTRPRRPPSPGAPHADRQQGPGLGFLSPRRAAQWPLGHAGFCDRPDLGVRDRPGDSSTDRAEGIAASPLRKRSLGSSPIAGAQFIGRGPGNWPMGRFVTPVMAGPLLQLFTPIPLGGLAP